MRNFVFVSSVFVLLLLLLINPLDWWMPQEIVYLAVALLAVVAAIFAGMIFGEQARDEREETLRARAARAGYLVGVFVLTLAIAVTVLRGDYIDIWIPITLISMVLVRVFVRCLP
ncbi:MAG: hypothetical protein ACJKTH_02580 [Patescibacteria group bacterium UBA2163]